MNTFNTAKHKLRDLYNTQTTNQDLINKKTNNEDKHLLDNLIFSKVKTLDDTRTIVSGDVQAEYQNLENASPNNNELLPVQLYYSYSKNFNILERYIPFIDWQYSFSTPKDETLVPSIIKVKDYWMTDFYEVESSAGSIWSGYYLPAYHSNTMVVPQQDFDDGLVSAPNTRAAWGVNVEWNYNGEYYRIQNGVLWGFLSNPYDVTDSIPPICSGQHDYYKLAGSININGESCPGDLHINGAGTDGTLSTGCFIDGLNLHVKGTELHTWGVEGSGEYGPICSFLIEYHVQVEHSFSSITDFEEIYLLGSIEKRSTVEGEYVWTVTSENNAAAGHTSTVIVTNGLLLRPNIANITSWEVSEIGKFIFYDTNKFFLCNSTSKSFPYMMMPKVFNPWDFDEYKYAEAPFDEFSVYVNRGDHPLKYSQTLTEDKLLQTFYFADNSEFDNPVWLKTSKSNAKIESWLVSLQFSAIQMMPATRELLSSHKNWHDSYNKQPISGYSGYNYTLTSSDHTSTKSRTSYMPEIPTATARVVGKIRSCMYWKKTSHFIKEVL